MAASYESFGRGIDRQTQSTMRAEYIVTELSFPPGYQASRAVDINCHGQVVGWIARSGSPFHIEACSWLNGALSLVSMPDPELASSCAAINDCGDIIGKTYQLIIDNGPAGSPVELQTKGKPSIRGRSDFLPFIARNGQASLFQYPQAGHVLLRGINNHHHIIGWHTVRERRSDESFLRTSRVSFFLRSRSHTPASDETMVITTADYGQFQAFALSDADQIVGSADGGESSHAWLWNQGSLTDLGTLGDWCTPHAVNSAGQVVGESIAADGELHGFMWENGSMINIDGERWQSRPLDINDMGLVVGSFADASLGGDGPIHGFVWQNGDFTDLNDIVEFAGTWTITEAVAINAHGQIACNGHRAGDERQGRGLLLTPR